jgi:hypothetical protein
VPFTPISVSCVFGARALVRSNDIEMGILYFYA